MTGLMRIGAAGMAYAAVVLILLWGRTLEGAYVLAAGPALLIAIAIAIPTSWRDTRRRKFQWFAALVALLAAVAAGLITERRLQYVASDWDRLVAEREARLAGELDRRMARLTERGRRAAERAAAAVTATEATNGAESLDEIRSHEGAAALAVIDGTGEFVAWAGEHRGKLPDAVRSGDAPVLYAERPLVSYLYFTAPVQGRDAHAVAAVLLQTGLVGSYEESPGFAEWFAERIGAHPSFGAGGGAGSSWSFVQDADTVVHARFEPITQAEWRSAAASSGRHFVLGFAGIGLLFLLLVWVSGLARSADTFTNCGITFVAIAVALAIAPIGGRVDPDDLFSPALFLLPLPWNVSFDISLGTLLAVLLPIGAFAAAFVPRARARPPFIAMVGLGAAAVAVASVVGLNLLLAGATPELLAGGFMWAAFFPAAVILITTVSGLVLPHDPSTPTRPVLIGAGLTLCVFLSAAVFMRWQPGSPLEPWLPALWAIPFVPLAMGLAGSAGRASRLMRWLAMGWLATTLVLPHVWVSRFESTLRTAERELATLGTRTDPFVDYYLLRHFAQDAVARHASGEDGVELLYRAWVTSGLAQEADPARITLWSADGSPQHDLVLGNNDSLRYDDPPTALPRRLAERARATGEPAIEAAQDSPRGNHVLGVPLNDGRLISVIVPPRRSLDRSLALIPLVSAEPRPDMDLTLIHAVRAPSTLGSGEVSWRRTDQGWRSETVVRYPDGEYHAHLDLRTPSLSIQLARAILLLAAMLAVLTALWALGRAGRGDPPAPPGGWRAWLGSFRARVTLALFAFFLIPTVIFGAVAYQALAGESARAARFVAERAVSQAVDAFDELEDGDLRAIAARTGEEVLYYHRGELADASSPEAVQLGVYGAWMPYSIFRLLQSGEELDATETRQLGGREYVIAYRPLVAGALAVPISLTGGDAAVRQQELAHLILFAALLGGILSLVLSVAVGRALADPIGKLRRASAAVGEGQLRVVLPEDRADEFGQLFGSFNQMARGLRKARAQELRTARVLAWGELARQIAHGIKNPLTPIKLSVQHLRRAYADGRSDFSAVLDRNVEQILSEIDRLSELARAFSRYGAPATAAGGLEAVDVGGVVREALTLYRAGEADVSYGELIEEDLPLVRARTGELKEVILNLLENARAALDGGGTVSVHARQVDSNVELEVRDDGQGIPPDLLPRIFEPHFSTRSAGTGLGLAIVRQLVEGWGGRLSAESEPGHGATIRLVVPIAEESPKALVGS